ncbi:hypothetical protein BKA62DRAFT_172245 [Auriculariales sp. MPI-PUGE-AT-0066]|nr:hypothetical protein BKA62DRAFT_172245 [Auriculariales sp. MPI-PUGE-AT-0066]
MFVNSLSLCGAKLVAWGVGWTLKPCLHSDIERVILMVLPTDSLLLLGSPRYRINCNEVALRRAWSNTCLANDNFARVHSFRKMNVCLALPTLAFKSNDLEKLFSLTTLLRRVHTEQTVAGTCHERYYPAAYPDRIGPRELVCERHSRAHSSLSRPHRRDDLRVWCSAPATRSCKPSLRFGGRGDVRRNVSVSSPSRH